MVNDAESIAYADVSDDEHNEDDCSDHDADDDQ